MFLLYQKIVSYTDESGQDTRGKLFIVCTICIFTEDIALVEKKLFDIEKKSQKSEKWFNSRDKVRHEYIRLLLSEKIYTCGTFFLSTYENTRNYEILTGKHIAKSILRFTKGKGYKAKIFIDKTNKRSHERIKSEVKTFHITYKKIARLSEKGSPIIRLSDAICGMISRYA